MSEPNQSNYQQQVFSFISSITGQKNIVPIPIEFVRFTGDYHTAGLLNQIIYWTGRTKDPDGWFYKSYEQWEEELALNKYFVSKSANILKKMGIIETQVKKVIGDPTLHYRIKHETFIDLFGKHLERKKTKGGNSKEPLTNGSPKSPNFVFPEITHSDTQYPLHSFVSSNFKLTKEQSLNKGKTEFSTNLPLYTETTSLKTTTTNPPTNVTQTSNLKPPENKETLLLLSLEKDVKKLIDLIPSHNLTEELTPQFNSLISKALKSHSIDSIAKAIQYTIDKSKGSPFEFKSYLGKTLLNNFHAGYVSKEEALKIKHEKQRQLEQDRKDAEILKKISERQRQEELRLRDQVITQTLNDLKLNNLSKYQELQNQAVSELKAHAPRKYDLEGAFVKSKMGVLLGL